MGTERLSDDRQVYILIDGKWEPLEIMAELPTLTFDECEQKNSSPRGLVRKVIKVIVSAIKSFKLRGF